MLPSELGDIAEANGFRIKGVATLSQHTYGQIQLGSSGKTTLPSFRNSIFICWPKAEEPETVIPPGNYPYKVVETKAKFKPTTNGNCLAWECALEIVRSERSKKDIKDGKRQLYRSSMRCVKNCPMKAKSVVADAFSDFEKAPLERLKNRKENEFFVCWRASSSTKAN